jgi:hypothetical protein
MQLKVLVLDAYKKQEQQSIEHQSAIALKQENALKRHLDKWGVTGATVIGNIVEAGGITLKAKFSSGTIDTWTVKGVCPKCQNDVWSSEIYSTNDPGAIGMMIENFNPDYRHQCQGQGSDSGGDDWGTRLIKAVNNAIDEALSHRGISE